MAWRFKASKYKNATPIVPKPEQCIRDLTVGSYQTYGASIAASAAFMAFNVGQTGQSLSVLPLQDQGRKAKDMALLHGHSDTVTDMCFSPFHDGLLATGSQDCLLKIWCIPEGGLESSLTEPESTIPTRTQRRVETVLFHPVADCLLATSSWTVVSLWDITSQQCLYSNSSMHGEVIQCISWRSDGQLLASTCKDKLLRVIDPRSNYESIDGNLSTNSHQGIKDSRVIWLNDNISLLTTGFNQTRQREISIRDTRKLSTPIKLMELDSSTGILLPLYDNDTGMLFLAGKGDTSIQYFEVINREPYLVEGLRHNGDQTKGAALVPKRALHVMQAEVNRILQLTANMVVPITYQVPRKTYRDFHADLYPETCGSVSDVTPTEWISGVNGSVKRVSLDPSKNTPDSLVQHRGSLKQLTMELDVRQRAKPTCHPQTGHSNMIHNNNNNNNNNINNSSSNTKMQKLNYIAAEEVNGGSGGGGGGGGDGGGDGVPRPKPRSSRSCSIEDDNCSKPVARPRMHKNSESIESANYSGKSDQPVIFSVNPLVPVCGGYKPRLGPKPFTPPRLNSFSERDSPSLIETPLSVLTTNTDDGSLSTPRKVDNHFVQDIKESEEELKKYEIKSGDENVPPKTPSLIERKRLFEEDKNEKVDLHDAIDDQNNSDQNNLNRNTSIAERRRLYENRSVSMVDDSKSSSPVPLRRRGSVKGQKEDNTDSSAAPKRTSTVFGRVSKFRHLKGTPLHKSTHIENIRNVSRQVSGECDGFHANCMRVAVPLSGPGGKIAVFELSQTGRLTDGVIPALVNGSNVMDFCWDPFDNTRLAASCDDGIVRIWRIPENGLAQPSNEPELCLEAHSDKIYCVKFHPLARDVLATAAHDTTIRIWDLNTVEKKITLTGHEDQILCMAWSPCGQLLVTACKDGELRIFNPRRNTTAICKGRGPVGTRAARIIWALDGTFLVVMGFDKVSERQIYIYDSPKLELLHTVGLDVSPAILIPFYDEDSSTLFLTGRGDTTIYTFEVTDEPPYLCPLSHHRCATLHQGLAFLPKNACDVGAVEFARALRLTNSTIEPISFTVPRIKSELFQDDLFPPTKVTWQPCMESGEWFAGMNRQLRRFNLQPPHMQSLSSAAGNSTDIPPIKSEAAPKVPSMATMRANFSHTSPEMMDYIKSTRDQLHAAVSRKVEINLSLEQDQFDGVEEHEWND